MYFTVSVLSASAGLSRVLAVHVNSLGKGLLVSNLRSAYVCLYVELTQQTVYNNIQMQLAHTGDDGLSRLLVGTYPEGGILLGQLYQSLAHLVLAGLGLGLDCDIDNRLRELHGLQDYRVLLITDGVTGGGVLKAYCGSDIAGVNLIQLASLVGVHLKDTANTLFLALGGVEHIGTGIHGSGVNPEERKLSYKGIGHDLECQSSEGLLIGGVTHYLVSIQIHALDGGDVGRSRHILDHGIQKLLNAFVAVSGAAAYRDRGTLAGCLSQSSLQLLSGGLFTLQVFHHQIIVQLADLLDQLGVVQLCLVLHILRDVNDRDVLALVVIVDISLHLEQVDDSLKLILFADGQLQTDGVFAQSGLNLLHSAVEVRSQDIHLVDECHTGNIVGVSLTPYVLRLGLNAALRAEHAYGAVQHAQRTLYLNRKVNVSRSINNVNPMLQGACLLLAVILQSPVAGCSG